MAQELSDVDPDEVSPVGRGANLKRFALLKEAGGTMQLSKELEDAASVPHPNEGAMVDALRKGGASESAQDAAVLMARLSKALEDELPVSLHVDVDAIAKGMTAANADDEPEDEPEEVKKFRSRLKEIVSKKGKAFVDAIPKEWGVADAVSNVNKETNMGDGTVQVPVRKEDGSWDLSGVAAESRPFYESVLKAQDDLTTENKTLREGITKAQEEVGAEREKRVEAELVQKARGDFAKVGVAADVVEVLKAARGKLTVDEYEKLESVLKGANERIDTGDLFKELGASGGLINDGSKTDAWSKIEKAAKEIVEKAGDTPLSEAQAVARVMREQPALYSDYLAEANGGVR